MPHELQIFEANYKGYTLTTDRRRVDLAKVHRFLAEEAYWARGVARDVLARAIEGSLPISIFAPDGDLAAFGRIITDDAMFAYLRDVFCLPEHRGKGLATWMALEIRNHPALRTVTTWMLSTRDAHAVYEKAGYRPHPHPEYLMRLPKPGAS